MDNAALKDTVLKLKERIIRTEAGNMQLSETDTRQGLINPLFRALQWDFSDFESIRSELRVPQFNEPADYAFYSSKKKRFLTQMCARFSPSRSAAPWEEAADMLVPANQR